MLLMQNKYKRRRSKIIIDMKNEGKMEKTLADHLTMGQAFLPVKKIIEEVPYEKVGVRPENLPYSFYELFSHIQYTQQDILNYCIQENYENPSWPEDYWPDQPSPESEKEWSDLKRSYFESREALKKFLLSSDAGLTDKVAGQSDSSTKPHTILREVLLVIEHSAYHTGQLVLIARLLGVYSKKG